MDRLIKSIVIMTVVIISALISSSSAALVYSMNSVSQASEHAHHQHLLEEWSVSSLDTQSKQEPDSDPGQPLLLTPYIEKGEIALARNLSTVGSLNGTSVKSYAGFLTVNATYNSNLYFWFFPAQNNATNAPLILWLQGGPGSSSLFGLFVENGAFYLDHNFILHSRITSWNTNCSMLYIDNPVGTGFSFTDNKAGYANTEEEVATDLYNTLLQFFKIFYEYQDNDFYIAGESYAGKYVPALAYMIHMKNSTKQPINMKGVMLGDGYTSPRDMIPPYAALLFNVGLLDENERDYFGSMCDKAVQNIDEQKWLAAYQIMSDLIMGEPNYFMNHTGLIFYFNLLAKPIPMDFMYFFEYVNTTSVRRAIHVGNLTYGGDDDVLEHLLSDYMQSAKPWLATIMDNYKVLVYNGQLDLLVSPTMAEAMLANTSWYGLPKYKTAQKVIWKVNPGDVDVAGYVRNVDQFYQVMIRGAGHVAPYDQPVRVADMINRFIQGRPFSS